MWAKNRGYSLNVVNAGIPGNDTRMARLRFTRDVLAQHPNMVTILFGINDSAVDVSEGKTGPRLSMSEFEDNLSWMISTLQKHGVQPVLMTPNPVAWVPELRRLYGKPPYQLDDPDGFNVLLREYAKCVRRLAKRSDVHLVDIYQQFKRYSRSPGRDLNDLLLDGMHPNDAGHALIAKLVIRVLSKLFRSGNPPLPTTHARRGKNNSTA
jgi:lysophospholipase L1-like esterase